MQIDETQAYRDQYEYLADQFALLRRKADAYNIRSEAQETERMVRYSERTGFQSERSHLLEIYRGVERQAEIQEDEIRRRKAFSETQGVRFPLDDFIERHGLGPEEVQILLVLLYNESLGREHIRYTTGSEILNVVFPDPVRALRASQFLGGGATLNARGLIRAVSDDENPNFLRAAYEVTERTLYEVLGVRDSNRDEDLQLASRSSSSSLERSYRVVAPRVSLDQVVLPPALRNGISEVLWQAGEGKRLYRQWGLDRVLEKGKGTIVLMSGPPGTGKTMTAEAMAKELGRELFVADYSRLESKWIGETEKNIVNIFREAAVHDAVLLLDEADAVLSYRLDGGQYNDRAYNRQVSILLTEMEAFDGLCVLTTNRSVSLDDGLARRISASFTFPVPGPAERLRIWKSLLPREVPMADDINLEELAHRFPLAGGHIKNAIVTAVRKAGLRGGQEARVHQHDFGSAAAAERRSFHPGARPIGFGEGNVPFLQRPA